jgi:redox-sensitive bicupin YhaK (pirin superfamily)
MLQIRTVKSVSRSQPTLEGAGVHLKRAFGNSTTINLDPFLLLDDFHSDRPADYIAGFPWHPHRGIETITYVLHGEIRHKDSLGNGGVIGPGDVQWMTAGSGIIHEEMPQAQKPLLWGFQLWANLPKSHKMMDPRYREVKAAQIPEAQYENGIKIKVISGRVKKIFGPVHDIVTDPEYIDVTIPAGVSFTHPVKSGYTAFAYILEGEGHFDDTTKPLRNEQLVIFSNGNQIKVTATKKGIRFLLCSGQPIREPIAWYGPIVMNTEEELNVAFAEYRAGTFLKKKK